jgi:hypothetical protein
MLEFSHMSDIELEEKSTVGFFRKQFLTVTPLSRFLAAVIFMVAPFVGFYLGTQFQIDKYPATEVVIEKVFVPVPETVSEDLWYSYKHAVGFSLMVPKNVNLVESETSIYISNDKSTGYTIHFRPDVKNNEEAIQFAHDIYGSDCVVTQRSGEEGIYADIKFSVYRPNLDKMPDVADYGNCTAPKGGTVRFNQFTKLALAWHTWFDYALPKHDESWGGWSEGKGWSDEDNHYDIPLLHSIRFTY